MANRERMPLAYRKGLGAYLALTILACALALSTFVSALTIAELHDHECTGDDCPICIVLQASGAALTLASANPPAAIAGFAGIAAFAVVLATRRAVLAAESPVSLKVRLVI